MARSRSVDGRGSASGSGGAGVLDDDMGSVGGGMRRSRPGTPDGTCAGKREEEWQTVGRRGRRAPSPADGEGQVCWAWQKGQVGEGGTSISDLKI